MVPFAQALQLVSLLRELLALALQLARLWGPQQRRSQVLLPAN
jgi:hypothetical protein